MHHLLADISRLPDLQALHLHDDQGCEGKGSRAAVYTGELLEGMHEAATGAAGTAGAGVQVRSVGLDARQQ